MKKFTKQEIRDLFNQVMLGEISFSEMVKIMNERVNEANEPQYKDGDFVVGIGCIFIMHKQIDEDSAQYHVLYANTTNGMLLYDKTYSKLGGKNKLRLATEAEKQELLDALAKEGKRWNAEKLCVEDIPKRKFKKGDKVRIKHGVSSKTHRGVGPGFINTMDKFIGKELTVKEYSSRGWVVFYGYKCEFAEDWLEPYEELKEGDLAIFWDNLSRRYASVRIFGRLTVCGYFDITGVRWDNAIKFESKEQFEKLIKGEI
jgi:hypothetical protein